jgi:alkaline phosphatase
MAGRATRTIAALAAAAIVLALPLTAAAVGADKPLSRNVILLIDDGAGYDTHEIGSLYDTGLPDDEAYQAFPFRFGVSTFSYGDVAPGACRAWSDWSYRITDPTDSAAAATAMATGTKT